MKVLLGHFNWGLSTIGPHSDPTDKTFLGMCIVSNVSKWSNLLLKMGYKLLSLSPIIDGITMKKMLESLTGKSLVCRNTYVNIFILMVTMAFLMGRQLHLLTKKMGKIRKK